MCRRLRVGTGSTGGIPEVDLARGRIRTLIFLSVLVRYNLPSIFLTAFFGRVTAVQAATRATSMIRLQVFGIFIATGVLTRSTSAVPTLFSGHVV